MTQLALTSKLVWHILRGNKSRQQQLFLRAMICSLLQTLSKIAAGAPFDELRKGIKWSSEDVDAYAASVDSIFQAKLMLAIAFDVKHGGRSKDLYQTLPNMANPASERDALDAYLAVHEQLSETKIRQYELCFGEVTTIPGLNGTTFLDELEEICLLRVEYLDEPITRELTTQDHIAQDPKRWALLSELRRDLDILEAREALGLDE